MRRDSEEGKGLVLLSSFAKDLGPRLGSFAGGVWILTLNHS
jgi:hypothetical protein